MNSVTECFNLLYILSVDLHLIDSHFTNMQWQQMVLNNIDKADKMPFSLKQSINRKMDSFKLVKNSWEIQGW